MGRHWGMFTRDDFLGRWQLTRQIDDKRAGQAGVFTGEATIAANGNQGAIYSEAGILRLGDGPAFQAERSYLWTFSGNSVAVRFTDGGAFHTFQPDGKGAGTDHPCGDDYYRVVYDFSDWPVWHSIWTVNGPRKAYVMQTQHKLLA